MYPNGYNQKTHSQRNYYLLYSFIPTTHHNKVLFVVGVGYKILMFQIPLMHTSICAESFSGNFGTKLIEIGQKLRRCRHFS